MADLQATLVADLPGYVSEYGVHESDDDNVVIYADDCPDELQARPLADRLLTPRTSTLDSLREGGHPRPLEGRIHVTDIRHDLKGMPRRLEHWNDRQKYGPEGI